jgi:hypothetical protein
MVFDCGRNHVPLGWVCRLVVDYVNVIHNRASHPNMILAAVKNYKIFYHYGTKLKQNV